MLGAAGLEAVAGFEVGEEERLAAVERVAHDGLVAALEVDANLVRAAGLGPAAQEGAVAKLFKDFKVRGALLAGARIGAEDAGFGGVRGDADVHVEHGLRAVAMREGEVSLDGSFRAELVGHRDEDGTGFGEEEDATGFKIEAVDVGQIGQAALAPRRGRA